MKKLIANIVLTMVVIGAASAFIPFFIHYPSFFIGLSIVAATIWALEVKFGRKDGSGNGFFGH